MIGPARLAAAALLVSLAVASAGCGGEGGLEELRRQGPGGEAAAELIAAHGGLAAFYRLVDLECRVRVERLDAAGALVAVADELHRFQAAPPARYLLRRTGAQVTEWGLSGQQGWLRIDGVSRPDPAAAAAATDELWLRWVLNRAPFSLADPGVRIQDDPASSGALVAEWPGGDERGSRRGVFYPDPETGRLRRVILLAPGQSLTSALREARAVESTLEGGVRLVTRWELADALPEGSALADLTWETVDLQAGNGFSDRLYRPSGE